MDLPMTATWRNCSGSGKHPNSIRQRGTKVYILYRGEKVIIDAYL